MTTSTPASLPVRGDSRENRTSQNVAIAYNYVLRANLLNEFRSGFSDQPRNVDFGPNGSADLTCSPVRLKEQIFSKITRRISDTTIIRKNEPMARRTTLRVGGPADLYVEPSSEDDLARILRFCAEERLPFIILGRGSNLLVRDGGVRGVVISLSQPCFSEFKIQGERMICGAGVRLKTIAIEAKRHGLAGFEFVEGIPGSVGGALRMNAGAMGSWFFDAVESIRFMDYLGQFTSNIAAAHYSRIISRSARH